jgi:hypothetical protein
MGRFIFLSAVAYLAYRYIGRSNKKHAEIVAKIGNTEVLPPAPAESAAINAAPAPQKLVGHSSAAAEPQVHR